MVEVDVQQVDDPQFETYTGDGNASGPCASMQPLVLGDVGRENLLALHSFPSSLLELVHIGMKGC
eukprot:4717714-Pleurochrysis_carterae.AAC.1